MLPERVSDSSNLPGRGARDMSKIAHCNCGALRVEVAGEPDAVVVCHCTDCQRRTGSVLGVGAYYPQDRVQVTGESRVFARVAASGRGLRQNFCTSCGTTLFWTSDNKPDSIGVAVGGFADPSFPAPVRSVWEQSHHGWVGLPPGIQHFLQGRDSGPRT